MSKKQFSKLASAVLLSQLLISTPLQVLADEQMTTNQSGSVEKQTEETVASSEAQTETTTTQTTTNPDTSATIESSTEQNGSDETSQTTDTTQSTTESTESSTEQNSSDETNQTTDTTQSTTESTENSTETSTSGSTNTSESSDVSSNEGKPVSPEMPTTETETQESQTQETGETSQTQVGAPAESQVTSSSNSSTTAVEETESKMYRPSPTAPIQELVPSSTETSEGNIHFEKDESVEAFIRKIGESARKIGQDNDLYASVMIAQAILESASGQSKLAQAPNYNLFGIKGTHKGKSVTFATQEDLGNGILYSTQATFRQYENYEDSLNDYATLLKEGITGDSQFYSGAWKSHASTYQEATKFLTGRYATDTKYNQKLNGLIETYDLTKYDQEVAGPKESKKGYMVPVKNYTISSPFGNRSGEFHRGLDLAAAQGEPIYASKAGTVIQAEYHPSWGNYVAIEHEDRTTTLYAHQQEYQVKIGEKVEQGQIIGYVGSTGNSTGSHLHFEICSDNSLSQAKLIDPATVLF